MCHFAFCPPRKHKHPDREIDREAACGWRMENVSCDKITSVKGPCFKIVWRQWKENLVAPLLSDAVIFSPSRSLSDCSRCTCHSVMQMLVSHSLKYHLSRLTSSILRLEPHHLSTHPHHPHDTYSVSHFIQLRIVFHFLFFARHILWTKWCTTNGPEEVSWTQLK